MTGLLYDVFSAFSEANSSATLWSRSARRLAANSRQHFGLGDGLIHLFLKARQLALALLHSLLD